MDVSVPDALPTVTGLLLARADSPQPGLRFEDRRWSWREHVGEFPERDVFHARIKDARQ